MIKVNGARGATLLGFGGMSVVFGLAYLPTPISIIPPIPLGLELLDSVVPLHLWGGVWMVVGLYLWVYAFRQDQSRALALFAGLCAVWGISYTIAFIVGLVSDGHSRLWVASCLYWSMLVACIGVSRLVNAPVQRINELIAEITEKEQ
ncbi:hypothetical protein SEA_NANCIA_19 [Arthrobacter phage Nancia]|uniref:Uncharacterized protein n=13 Tax=Korravirus drrobert TaxID=1982078 RepID=A0A222ZF95_9CAUD|nr:minor tail protein [Arthrobacter phage DrRobert]AOQ28293.1 hypothetical protein SEA_LUCY_19 [Arthrobacter phage Lucy]ASR83403.1 hypothetical protein SEA_CHRISTIAN_19 [Arthrobacter phage Christian]ASR83814.1 hypothetical protein SEA_PITADOG_19 [Arthrobacter phage PitaDog]AZF98275.1 hypothetical protein SEA_BODACIOUS_19 [Arthrobacter phage Bodacious]AZS07002.1 hypothetical protein SEA_CHEWCHEW_19 [Arthrobacter phage ChewChew]AZS07227.1 hypothetical protein SEA_CRISTINAYANG_19 [Arthrobacter p